MIVENAGYKYADYSVRHIDPYARIKYQILMAWLTDRKGLRVLNAGCGDGLFTTMLAEQHPSWRIDAIDIDEEAVARSRQDHLRRRNVRVFKVSIEDYRPDCHYNVIFAVDVLEHVSDDRAAVRALAQLLSPSGQLCLSVPALPVLYGFHDEMLGHTRRYTRSSLSKTLMPYFRLEHARYFGAVLIPIALLYSRLLRRSYPLRGLKKHGIASYILDRALAFEKTNQLPIGTSLLAVAS